MQDVSSTRLMIINIVNLNFITKILFYNFAYQRILHFSLQS